MAIISRAASMFFSIVGMFGLISSARFQQAIALAYCSWRKHNKAGHGFLAGVPHDSLDAARHGQLLSVDAVVMQFFACITPALLAQVRCRLLAARRSSASRMFAASVRMFGLTASARLQ